MAYTFPAPGDLTDDMTDDPRAVFAAMFAGVRAYLLSEGRGAHASDAVAINPKGEATRAFDAEAERIALSIAAERLGSFRAFTEEAGEIQVGDAPRWTLVIDPCDGSNNYRRGIRSVGFAVAALPVDALLDPDRVEYAVCGDIFTGALYSAARGRGATLDGQACATSATHELRHAVLGANVGRVRPATHPGESGERQALAERAWRVYQHASTIRRTGATVLDLCYVAQGAYDAYVDLRTRLTPENFLAPALVLHEAGGSLTDPHGRPLGAVEFTRPYSVLATGNDTLLANIITVLDGAPV